MWGKKGRALLYGKFLLYDENGNFRKKVIFKNGVRIEESYSK